jgi:CheY-like chemotaxis protein
MARPLVYVVDDDDSIRDILSELLKDSGYAVESFRNGREAAAALDSNSAPSLILLDWMMPGMGGEEFIRQESARLRADNIPVVVLSAIANRLKEIPLVWEKIAKPVDIDALLGTVERTCGLPSPDLLLQ